MITLAYFIGILVILFIIYKILTKVGLIKTGAKIREEKNQSAAKEELLSSEYFEPSYFHDKIGTYTSIGSTKTYAYSDQIHNAMSGFGTDEDLIYSIFLKLNCKINISEIATAYALNYKHRLALDLADDLNDAEVLKLMDIVNKLPNK
jgi:hypothetical protein